MTELIRLSTTPNVEKLSSKGFIEAGAVQGNADSMVQFLEQIYSGGLLDENSYRPKTPDEIKSINDKILQLKEENTRVTNKKQEFEDSIKLKNGKIEEINVRIEEYYENRTRGINKNEFDPISFSINTFFLLGLSAFIIAFYIPVVYKALFVSIENIAEQIKQGQFGIALLPPYSEVKIAIQENLTVVFAPFIFFGFGYAIHLIIESNIKYKYLFAASIIFVTLILDLLLAEQIINRMNQASDLMGMPHSGDIQGILIVIILGFFVYIIWSVLFHFWMLMINKSNPPRMFRRQIRVLEEQINDLQEKIPQLTSNINSNTDQVIRLNHELTNREVHINVIYSSIHEFLQGWLRYVAGHPNHEIIRENCKTKFSEFQKKHNLNGIDLYNWRNKNT